MSDYKLRMSPFKNGRRRTVAKWRRRAQLEEDERLKVIKANPYKVTPKPPTIRRKPK